MKRVTLRLSLVVFVVCTVVLFTIDYVFHVGMTARAVGDSFPRSTDVGAGDWQYHSSEAPADLSSTRKAAGCPGVLTAARQGSWHQELNRTQKQEMIQLYTQSIKRGDVPPFNSQRNDLKCGNVTFPDPHTRWRATCDPDGPTPCCYDSVCEKKPMAECTCKNCWDMRTMVFAEYATWHPTDERCPMARMTQREICELLKGRTVLVVGDSLMLHFYIGFLMVVRGEDTGALWPYAKEESKRKCRGKRIYVERRCTGNVDNNARLCGGQARARFLRFYHPSQSISPRQMTAAVLSELKRNKSIAVLGIGSHMNLNSTRATQESLLPLLQRLSAAGLSPSSKLLFAGVHAKKNFRKGEQEADFTEKVLRYNAGVEKALKPWGVSVLDSFNLTYHKVLSLDGNHYGFGVNRAKANILLHYFWELHNKGLW